MTERDCDRGRGSTSEFKRPAEQDELFEQRSNLAKDQFGDLVGFDAVRDAGTYTEHAAFGTQGNESWRRLGEPLQKRTRQTSPGLAPCPARSTWRPVDAAVGALLAAVVPVSVAQAATPAGVSPTEGSAPLDRSARSREEGEDLA